MVSDLIRSFARVCVCAFLCIDGVSDVLVMVGTE